MANKNKITTDAILNADCRKKEGRILLQKALRKIKAFEDVQDKIKIPLEQLEDWMCKTCNRYDVRPQWVNILYDVKKDGYRLYSLTCITQVKHEYIGTVYGVTIYELIAKMVFLIFSEIKKNKIKRLTDEQKQAVK